MELFSKAMFVIALIVGLACASGALMGCGSEDPNPNPGEDAGTNDTDSGETDAGTTDAGVRCGDTKCEGDENCDSCALDCGCGTDQYCKSAVCVANPFPSVAGDWDITYKSTGDEKLYSIQLTQNGDQISGKDVDPDGCPYSGTIAEDGNLSLSENCIELQISLIGKLINPNRMEGTFNSIGGSGTWWADKK